MPIANITQPIRKSNNRNHACLDTSGVHTAYLIPLLARLLIILEWDSILHILTCPCS